MRPAITGSYPAGWSDWDQGPVRREANHTTVGALEKLYGVDLHRRSDMTLGALRKEMGETGIKELIEKVR